MDITPIISEGTNVITGYSYDKIKVNHGLVSNDFLLSGYLFEEWITTKNIFADENFQILFDHMEAKENLASTIVLIGTGKEYLIPPKSLFLLFAKYNIRPEIMTSLNVCRTFNVLVSEQREVFALVKNNI